MLEMIKGELTVTQLLRVLKAIRNPDETYVATENVQDGINRHNGIVGFEDDYGDEYLILKIFNERHEDARVFANKLAEYLDDKIHLSQSEEKLLVKAQEYND